jgi:Domain of unknown function (DUF4177)
MSARRTDDDAATNADETPAVIQWEYLVETVKNPEIASLRDQLNRLGADGWELVAMTTTVKTWLNLTGNDLVLTFKRPGPGAFVRRPEDEPGHIPWA